MVQARGKVVACWKSHEKQLPTWSSACKAILLVQEISVAAECVSSLFAI